MDSKKGWGGLGGLLIVAVAASMWWRAQQAQQVQLPVNLPPVHLKQLSPLEAALRDASTALGQNQFEQAIVHATEAIQLQPKNGTAYVMRAVAHAALLQNEKAIADCNEALRFTPHDPAVFWCRGAVYTETKQYDQAFADLTEALRLLEEEPKTGPGPTLPVKRLDLHAARAQVSVQLKNYDEAIADMSEEIRLRLAALEEDARNFRMIAGAGGSDEAIHKKHAPEIAGAYQRRGDVFLLAKKHDDALADFNQALKLEPEELPLAKGNDTFANIRPAAHVGLGKAWAGKKDYVKAQENYTTAIRLDAKHRAAHNGLAWIWATCPDEKVRDGPKAVEYATRVCEWTAWKNVDYLATLAAAEAECSHFGEAIKWQQKALDLAGDEKTLLRTRLQLYQSGTAVRDE